MTVEDFFYDAYQRKCYIEKITLQTYGIENRVYKIDINSNKSFILKISCSERFLLCPDTYYKQSCVINKLLDFGNPVEKIVSIKVYPDLNCCVQLYKYLPGYLHVPKNIEEITNVVMCLKNIQDVRLLSEIINLLPRYEKNNIYRNLDNVSISLKEKIIDECNSLPDFANENNVLAHGDFQPGNLIWNENDIKLVIDWDNVCLAPPELDVAHYYIDLLILSNKENAKCFIHRAYQLLSLNTKMLNFFVHYDAAYTYINYYKWINGYWGQCRIIDDIKTNELLVEAMNEVFSF